MLTLRLVLPWSRQRESRPRAYQQTILFTRSVLPSNIKLIWPAVETSANKFKNLKRKTKGVSKWNSLNKFYKLIRSMNTPRKNGEFNVKPRTINRWVHCHTQDIQWGEFNVTPKIIASKYWVQFKIEHMKISIAGYYRTWSHLNRHTKICCVVTSNRNTCILSCWGN